jgi:2-polyprenyl-6-methoxyphenol hydroxylase-like FAD-dependent oxidoreductase
MSPFKVIIIGSGLAGSLLPNGLARHIIEYAVYERYERSSKKEGYQIRLGENALIGLRACLEKDRLVSIVRKFGCASALVSDAPIIYDHHFKRVLDLGAFPAYAKSAPINRVILRDALAEPLDRAGRLHYEKTFSRYEIVDDFGSERVRVWFEDGTSDDCDILVGADGNHSRVRSSVPHSANKSTATMHGLSSMSS